MIACQVCKEENSLYKCPTCRLRYCSVNCFKMHKLENCNSSDPLPVETESQPEKFETTYRYPTEDTVPVEKLSALRDSDDVKNCLNNPHVRTIMKGILEAEDPTLAIAEAMTEPIFVELADACLRVVEPQDEVESSS